MPNDTSVNDLVNDMVNKSIVIVEDHPVMLRGLAEWFTATGRWQVLGTASSLATARELLDGISPDVLLLDIKLSDGWSLDIIPWYKQHLEEPLPKIAVYSSFDDYPNVSTALGMGVDAYICKHRSEQELEAALLQALDGKNSIDDTVRTRLNTINVFIDVLTRREGEVLGQVKKGMSNKEIAFHLGISIRRVENILSCIYDKTGIKTRLELQQL
jgi:NarL family two-component system response regulator LiaR